MHEAGKQTDSFETSQLALAGSFTDQFIAIHMGEGSPEIFRLTFNRETGQVEAIIAEGASIEQAARIFINELRFHGQSLMDTIKAEEAKTVAIHELAKQYPNDMEFGNKVRQYLNENSANRSR